MADVEMAEDKPESSKAGLRRMQRLASLPASYQPSQHATIQPETAQLIHSFPGATRPAVISTLFGPTKPRVLPTPPILLPPSLLSVSPSGEWLVAFHPSQPVPGLLTEGGTIAIYRRSILEMISTPNRVLAHATFNILSSPLAICQLYPPRRIDANGKMGPQSGPRPPAGYASAKGPTFVVLSHTGVVLFLPDRNGTIKVIRGPLHTRWSATADGEAPPEMGKRVHRGTLEILPGDDGVWAGWQVDEEIHVTRLDIGTDRFGSHYLRSTPMPTLPSLNPPNGDRVIDRGVAFVALRDEQSAVHKPANAMHGNDRTRRIGTVIIQPVQNSQGNISTRLNTVAFERRENEIAHAFTELSGEESSGRTSDWFTAPSAVSQSSSPPNTSIVALAPLPLASPRTLAVAVLSRPSGTALVHLDLCQAASSETEDRWNAIVGKEVPLPLADVENLELVLSPNAEFGGLGLIGLMAEGRVTWVIFPSLSNGTETDTLVAEAAKSILLAIRQDTTFSDIVRAATGSIIESQKKATAIAILQKVHEKLRSSSGVDAVEELCRLQTTLFSACGDSRKQLSRELATFCLARRIFASCSERSESSKTIFDNRCLWNLLNVSEAMMVALASVFREVIALQGKLEWEEPDVSLPTTSRAIYIIHPHVRFLVVDLLFYFREFIAYCMSLEQSIAPPPDRTAPKGAPDPRVTVVLKDCVRDLEVKYGLDIEAWGKALTALNIKAGLSEADLSNALTSLSLEPIQPLVMPTLASLPSPSSLLLAAQDEAVEYDAVNFTPLPPPSSHQFKSGLATCERCGGRTAIFREKIIKTFAEGGGMLGQVSPASSSGGSGWDEWRKAAEIGCGCGGTWT